MRKDPRGGGTKVQGYFLERRRNWVSLGVGKTDRHGKVYEVAELSGQLSHCECHLQ